MSSKLFGVKQPKATQAQIDYAESLMKKLGYDPNNYDLESMTSWAISELIDELKEEWGE